MRKDFRLIGSMCFFSAFLSYPFYLIIDSIANIYINNLSKWFLVLCIIGILIIICTWAMVFVTQLSDYIEDRISEGRQTR